MEISRAKWPGTQLFKLFRTESLLLHLSSTTLKDPGSARRAKVLLSKCREEPYDNVRGTRSVSGGLLGGKNSLRARLGGRSPDCRRHYRYLRRTSGALPD